MKPLPALLAAGFLLALLAAPALSLGPRGAVADAAETCGERRDWESCYAREFEKISLREGPAAAFRALGKLQEKDPRTNGCHFIAHGIGYGAYGRDPGNWREAFQSVDQSCTYGAMHGVLERAIADMPGGLSADVLPEICGSAPRGDCNHIVGHLVLVEAKRDIPAALRLCAFLGDEGQRAFCTSGVFMEEMTAVNLVKHGYADESALRWAGRAPEFVELCGRYDGRTAIECWREFAHVAVAAGGDAAGTFALCEEGGRFAEVCKLHAVGILGSVMNFEFPRAAAACGVPGLSPAFLNKCYAGLAGSALASNPALAEDVVGFCAGLPGEYRRSCFGVAAGTLAERGYTLRDLEKLCAPVPRPFRTFCERGSGERLYEHGL